MLKSLAFAASVLLATAAPAQTPQSLQSLHARVPAPPASVATAQAWLASPQLVALRQQLKDQRAFVEKLTAQAGSDALPTAGQTGGVDFQRAARDPAYAEQLKAKIAAMSQEEQMKLAMQMSQAQSQSALRDVKAMATDPESVSNAADHYPDYQAKQVTGGITAQYTVVDKILLRPLPYPLATVLAMLATDKKHSGGRLRWVLPTADGTVVRPDVPDELVARVAAGLLTPAAAGTTAVQDVVR